LSIAFQRRKGDQSGGREPLFVAENLAKGDKLDWEPVAPVKRPA
jgi:hypothetical protein